MTKRCSLCKEIKPITEYWRNPQGKNGYRAMCKSCCRTKDWYKNRHQTTLYLSPQEAIEDRTATGLLIALLAMVVAVMIAVVVNQ